MISDNKRVAYCKIPIKEIFYSKNSFKTGINCARVQTHNLKVIKIF